MNHKKHREMLKTEPKVEIKLENIIVWKSKHRKALQNPPKNLTELVSLLKEKQLTKLINTVTLKEIGGGKYKLHKGFKAYYLAQELGIDKINAIVVEKKKQDYSRGRHPLLLEDIIIPKEYKEYSPQVWKLERATRELESGLNRSILINKENVLKDGYTRYISAKLMGLEIVDVEYTS